MTALNWLATDLAGVVFDLVEIDKRPRSTGATTPTALHHIRSAVRQIMWLTQKCFCSRKGANLARCVWKGSMNV